MPHPGPNAVEILQAIGVWDDVLSKVIGSRHVNLHSDWMQYRSGKEGSELIYDVSRQDDLSYNKTDII